MRNHILSIRLAHELNHPMSLRICKRAIGWTLGTNECPLDFVKIKKLIFLQGMSQQFIRSPIARLVLHVNCSSFGKPVWNAIACAIKRDRMNKFMTQCVQPIESPERFTCTALSRRFECDDRTGACCDRMNLWHACDAHCKIFMIRHQLDRRDPFGLMTIAIAHLAVHRFQLRRHACSQNFVNAGSTSHPKMFALKHFPSRHFFQ